MISLNFRLGGCCLTRSWAPIQVDNNQSSYSLNKKWEEQHKSDGSSTKACNVLFSWILISSVEQSSKNNYFKQRPSKLRFPFKLIACTKFKIAEIRIPTDGDISPCTSKTAGRTNSLRWFQNVQRLSCTF